MLVLLVFAAIKRKPHYSKVTQAITSKNSVVKNYVTSVGGFNMEKW